MDPTHIAEAGPWAVLVFVLIAGIGGLWTAFLRRWVVPGYLYDALRDDWKTLRDQGDRNSKALELMAKRYESLRRER